MKIEAPKTRQVTFASRVFFPAVGTFRLIKWLNRSKAAMMGAVVLILVIIGAVFAPKLTPYDYKTQNFKVRLMPPALSKGGSWSHPLGTDPFGRDILTRILYAGQVAIWISAAATAIGAAVGITLGLLSAYFGGWMDTIIMRMADIQWSIPFLILAIAVMFLFGPSTPNLVLVLSLRGWITTARTIRGSVLSAKEEDYVRAAKGVGCSDLRIMFRHILPNVLAPIFVLSSFQVAGLILTEASLSFLGLGVQPPFPSWGGMLSQGKDYMLTAWWLAVMPGVALMITVLGANQLGDGLRDLLDPRLRGTT